MLILVGVVHLSDSSGEASLSCGAGILPVSGQDVRTTNVMDDLIQILGACYFQN